MGTNDTICAIATPPGEAGIAVLRLSGSDSLKVAQRVFSTHESDLKPGCFYHGTVHEPDAPEKHIDEAILLVFKAPHSYTGEEAAEIQCHGGHTRSRSILSALIVAGARQADPGEFTRRAFLNGKIDLVQAEAVADLIHARSDRAAESALRQLEGSISSWYRDLYNGIVRASAAFEASLDFGEEELPSSIFDEPVDLIVKAADQLKDALATWNDGRLLQEGVRVVIAGRPNAGKSSLFNCMLGYDRAIVAEVAGTTRDTLDDCIIIDGITVQLTDTAGLRESSCDIESEGVTRAQRAVDGADLTLYVVDSSQSNHADELKELNAMDPARTLVVLNKSDLPSAAGASFPSSMSSCRCSCKTGDGIQSIKQHLASHMEGVTPTQLNAMNQRHRTLCEDALAALTKAIELCQNDPETQADLIATHLRTASQAVGSVLGAEYHNDLLDNIFQQFCIGK